MHVHYVGSCAVICGYARNYVVVLADSPLLVAMQYTGSYASVPVARELCFWLFREVCNYTGIL